MTEDDRPKRYGWAPGSYMCRCSGCGCTFTGDKRAVQCADCAYANWKPSLRHVKSGGLYQIVRYAKIEATLVDAVVYEAVDGTCWVRPKGEFFDGRFVTIET